MPAPGTLDDVVAGVLRDVAKREAAVSFQEIKARSRDMAPTRDARAALLRHGCSVIVEIKRNSPVFGPTAETLDLTRYHDRKNPAPRHLAFSLGIHYCLGAPLALLEMELLLAELVERVDVMELLTDRPPYKQNLIVRGLAALPTRFKAL